MNAPVQIKKPRGIGCLHVLLILIVLLLGAILASMWWLKRNIHAAEFTPVELTPSAQLVLDEKLNAVDPTTSVFGGSSPHSLPGVYQEDHGKRRLVFTQEELNAVLAKDPDFARLVKFRLSDQLVSIQFLTPVDPSIPMIGGKTLRFDMGITLGFASNKPVVNVKGISLGGIPLPGAWWGDVKGINLADNFGAEGGFWDLFSRGVENLEVKEGKLILHLKE